MAVIKCQNNRWVLARRPPGSQLMKCGKVKSIFYHPGELLSKLALRDIKAAHPGIGGRLRNVMVEEDDDMFGKRHQLPAFSHSRLQIRSLKNMMDSISRHVLYPQWPQLVCGRISR